MVEVDWLDEPLSERHGVTVFESPAVTTVPVTETVAVVEGDSDTDVELVIDAQPEELLDTLPECEPVVEVDWLPVTLPDLPEVNDADGLDEPLSEVHGEEVCELSKVTTVPVAQTVVVIE